MEEPSVLDYVKSKLTFGSHRQKISLPATDPSPPPEHESQPPARAPWFALAALGLALTAQFTFEPPHTNSPWAGIFLYLTAIGLLIVAFRRSEWMLPDLPQPQAFIDPLTFRYWALLGALAVSLIAFSLFGNNRFTSLNLILWITGLVLFIWSLWVTSPNWSAPFTRLRDQIQKGSWQFTISPHTLLLLAVIGLALFFRLHQVNQVVVEPFSDHAEKILDVYNLTQGETYIFFERNTGREAFQMYWTAFVAWVSGLGVGFTSLKLGTILLGILTLPYMYLLGKELGGKRTALLVLLLVGIAYWPNVISRIGLRFPLYPLFTAPVLYYLIKGLRTQNRNDFILAGLFLGIGLHGYSTFRFVPVVVVIGVALYILHQRNALLRTQTIVMLVMSALTSIIVFLPLLRYAIGNPASFSYRMLTRMTEQEAVFQGSPVQIFFSNLWKSLTMFNWDNGQIWVHSIPHRPALDVVSAALFLLGISLLVMRYIKQRHWQDLFLLVAIPLLLMPSALSLAFPNENPSLNRSGGALVVVFIVVALALDGLVTALLSGARRASRKWVSLGLVGMLLALSITQNYALVFEQFSNQFRQGTWNSSEIGGVVRQFWDTYDRQDNAWIVPYPHWVDTRLPAVVAGIPNGNLALWREQLPDTLDIPGPKMLIVKPNDLETIEAIEALYPQASRNLFTSASPGRDFLIFFIHQ